ncbi:hypothetical protein ACSBL2_24560 [Pedobacter sp. AW31-3R]|uniref:hypothetical protein n=1 Tax=Pedobacter sp. AW31-3R TaxID=3445781 RepID=UPI003FA01E96
MGVEKVINAEIHSWSSVKVNLLGRSIVGLKGIEYSDSQETKGVKGRGKKDIGFVTGNYAATGKLTLEMAEVEALNKLMTDGISIYDIPAFDIIVCYRTGNELVTHKLKNCRFTGQGRTGKAGEVKEFEVELPLYVGDIDWNA